VGHLIALGLAVAAALGYGISSLLQSEGAAGGERVLGILGRPAYLAGVALDLLAWLLSLAALRALPVFQVQAVLAGSLAVTAVAARLVQGVRLRRADAVAVVVTVAALAALAMSAGPQPAEPVAMPVRLGILGAVLAVAAAGWFAGRARQASLCAVLAGLAFGGTALAARGLHLPQRPLREPLDALGTIVADPLWWALAVSGIAGMLLYAQALAHGDVARGTALLWIVEVLAPGAAGVVLFGDAVRPGWAFPAVLALFAALAAAVVLASAPAQRAEATP
jgi:drug/metabolite transporter (DMT)-like permease